MLTPTKIYVNEITKLVDRNLINGSCNITGGGLLENIPRVLKNGICANINLEKIKVKKIFRWINKQGVEEKEMLKTFNCGVGFVLFAKKQNIKKIQSYFSKSFKPYIVGTVQKNSNAKIKFNGRIKF